MDVSVIIVNYNTRKLTLGCIDSVRNSKPKASCEIIVIDNDSTDGSAEELSKLGRTITLIKNKENLGFARAVNQGINKAKGKYILLLNSDTKVKKGSVDGLVEFAKNNPDVGAVAPRLVNTNGSVQASVYHLPTFWRAVGEYWLGYKGMYTKYVPDEKEFCQVEGAVMAAFLITPEGLKKVGKLDEKYFLYFEDYDYCKRIKEQGLKVYYLPSVEIEHAHGASGKNLTDDLNQWRRLIVSSKIYHGVVKHYCINFILWVEQRVRRTLIR